MSRIISSSGHRVALEASGHRYHNNRAINLFPNAVFGAKNAKKLLRPISALIIVKPQDHRFIKRKIKPGLGFFSYPTAWRTIRGYEVMHMIRKGQIVGVGKRNILAQNLFIAGLFGLVA
jgi:hypothetical protein